MTNRLRNWLAYHLPAKTIHIRQGDDVQRALRRANRWNRAGIRTRLQFAAGTYRLGGGQTIRSQFVLGSGTWLDGGNGFHSRIADNEAWPAPATNTPTTNTPSPTGQPPSPPTAPTATPPAATCPTAPSRPAHPATAGTSGTGPTASPSADPNTPGATAPKAPPAATDNDAGMWVGEPPPLTPHHFDRP